jgi:hypothetical protein
MIKLARILLLAPTLSASHPSEPLRDRDGAPACGNLGQVGRPRAVNAARIAIEPARPLTDADQRPACGNVMSKGSRPCK